MAAALSGGGRAVATECRTSRTSGNKAVETRVGDHTPRKRHPKKSHPSVLAGGIVSRYQFMAKHRRSYPIQRMCAVLGVAASGFYDWLRRKPSQRQQANEALALRIRAIHETSRQTYGYPRIHAELREAGEVVGKHRIARLMTRMGLKTRCRRRFRVTTHAN